MKKTHARSVRNADAQIGLRLRHMRIATGISQADLGQKVGISFQQVQKYEKGTNRLSLVRALEIAKVLNTTINELAGVNGGTAKMGTLTFDHQTYQLSQSLSRMNGLSVGLATKFKNLITSVCDDLESVKR